MWPFRNGTIRNGTTEDRTSKGGSTLTEEEHVFLRNIIQERGGSASAGVGKPRLSGLMPGPQAPQIPAVEDRGKPMVSTPKGTQITVAPVKEEKKKPQMMAILKPLVIILGISFLLMVVVAAILGLFTLLAAGVMGAVIIYVAGFYFFLAVGVLMTIVYVYTRIKMAPVWNYNKCVNHPGKALMLLMRKTGVASMEVARYVAETFEKDANIWKHEDPLAFFKTDNSPSILGRAGFGVFYDAANVMANPEFVLACQELKRQGYTNIEDAKTEYIAKKLTVNIPLFAEVDFGALYDFVKGRPSITKAYCDTKVNEARAERDQKFYENPQLMGIGFLIIMVIIGLGLGKAFNLF